MRTRHLIALTFALALIATAMQGTAPARAAGPTITEFPIVGSANPDLIAPGLPTDPAASVWVTDPYGGAGAAGAVYRVDTATGTLSGTFAPAAGATAPSFIARGPDGRMWVADFDGTLMRAGSDGVFEKLPSNGYAHNGLAVGPDGNVWYVSISGGANSGQVGLTEPTTLATAQFDIPTANSHPEETTPGPPSDPNSMWFTEESASRIGRVDTTTHQVTDYGGLTAGARPNGIVAGADGGIWFAEYGTGKIGRIDPITHAVTEYGVPGELAGPDRMTVAPDGRIWFTLLDGSQIGSFMPGPNPTFELIPTPTAGAQPSGITVGPDGHVWFAEYNNHAVGRIDGNYPPPTTTTTTNPPPTTTTTTTTSTAATPGPSTDIYAGPPSETLDRTATFEFAALIPGGPPIIPPDPVSIALTNGGDGCTPQASSCSASPIQFACQLDAGPWAPCASPYTTSVLALGDHTFNVESVGGAGASGPVASLSWQEIAASPQSLATGSCVNHMTADDLSGSSCTTLVYWCPRDWWCTFGGSDWIAGGPRPDSAVTDTEIDNCGPAGIPSPGPSAPYCPVQGADCRAYGAGSCQSSGDLGATYNTVGRDVTLQCDTDRVTVLVAATAGCQAWGERSQAFPLETSGLSSTLSLRAGGSSSGTSAVDVFVPGAGELAAAGIVVIGGHHLAADTARAHHPALTPSIVRTAKRGAATLRMRLNRAARLLLARRHKMVVRLTLTFTPSAGRSLIRITRETLVASPRCNQGSAQRGRC